MTYTPPSGYVGSDSFTYTLSDGFCTAQGTVAVSVVAANAPSENGISITPVAGTLVLEFLGIPGQVYVIQSAPVTTGPWSDLSGPLTADATGLITYTVNNPPSPQQYYRTRVGP